MSIVHQISMSHIQLILSPSKTIVKREWAVLASIDNLKKSKDENPPRGWKATIHKQDQEKKMQMWALLLDSGINF